MNRYLFGANAMMEDPDVFCVGRVLIVRAKNEKEAKDKLYHIVSKNHLDLEQVKLIAYMSDEKYTALERVSRKIRDELVKVAEAIQEEERHRNAFRNN